MVSITLAVPEDIRQKMKKHADVNWSGFIREAIIERTKQMEWKENMLKQAKQEQEVNDWAVKLQRSSRKGRLAALKKKGLV